MITHIRWASPEYFWLAPLVVMAIALVFYRMQYKRKAVEMLAGKWSGLVVTNHNPRSQFIKSFMLSFGIICLWVALLRPQWHKREQVIAQEGRDLLIALDISRSMLATDYEPNRLNAAKTKIKRLLNLLDCERVGLVLFSGSAFVQCPLTTDYASFLMHLDHVDAETISSGTTALGAALQASIDTYSAVANKKTKLLVIFTDGEDFSTNLSAYKKQAAQEGLHVFTIGVGTAQGAPIPLYDEKGNQVGHQKDAKGNVVISQLNEQILHSLSQQAGGHYIKMSSDNGDIKKLVNYISHFEKEMFEEKKVAQLDDKYHYFLAMSFLCFALEWVL